MGFIQIFIVLNTFLRKQLPDWFVKQIFRIGNKTKLLFTILVSVALSYILLFCHEIPVRECGLTFQPLFTSESDVKADINIAFDCGENITEDVHSSINLYYSIDRNYFHGHGSLICYFPDDTLQFSSEKIDSMMNEILIEKGLPVKPFESYLYMVYRERTLPNIYYYGDTVSYFADSTKCVKQSISLCNYKEKKYKRYSQLIAFTDTVVEISVYPQNELFHHVKWWHPYDISQAYVHFIVPYTSLPDTTKLSFTFNGATYFSEMNPKPDLVSMDAIQFTDPQKIKQIWRDGLWFHVAFPHMSNLQTVRMFVITTLLGFFIALAANILKNMILRYCEERYKKTTSSSDQEDKTKNE